MSLGFQFGVNKCNQASIRGQGGEKTAEWRVIAVYTKPLSQQCPVKTKEPGNLLVQSKEDAPSGLYRMSALILSITPEKMDPECASVLPEQMTEAVPRAGRFKCTVRGPVASTWERNEAAGQQQESRPSCLLCSPLISVSLGQKHQLSQGTEERGSFFQPSPQNFSSFGYETQLLKHTQTIITTAKQTMPCQAPF